MFIRRPLTLAVLASLLFACNFPLFTAAPAPAPSPANSGGSTAQATTAAPHAIPTLAPTATTIPTPSVPQVTPNSVAINCRSGPDVGYDATSAIQPGQTAQITGRNDDSSWWYVQDPNNAGNSCWVSASVVTTAGNLSGLPVIAPPAAIVTKVTVDASFGAPVCGGPNPVDFSGKITTNGPAKVQFQWETGGDKSNPPVTDSINFKSAGTKDVSGPGAYKVDCGHYTISLHVTSPNDVSATKSYKVQP